jgi:hypothetical protein
MEKELSFRDAQVSKMREALVKREEAEIQDKPTINKKSQKMTRSVTDMQDWNERKMAKIKAQQVRHLTPLHPYTHTYTLIDAPTHTDQAAAGRGDAEPAGWWGGIERFSKDCR